MGQNKSIWNKMANWARGAFSSKLDVVPTVKNNPPLVRAVRYTKPRREVSSQEENDALKASWEEYALPLLNYPGAPKTESLVQAGIKPQNLALSLSYALNTISLRLETLTTGSRENELVTVQKDGMVFGKNVVDDIKSSLGVPAVQAQALWTWIHAFSSVGGEHFLPRFERMGSKNEFTVCRDPDFKGLSLEGKSNLMFKKLLEDKALLTHEQGVDVARARTKALSDNVERFVMPHTEVKDLQALMTSGFRSEDVALRIGQALTSVTKILQPYLGASEEGRVVAFDKAGGVAVDGVRLCQLDPYGKQWLDVNKKPMPISLIYKLSQEVKVTEDQARALWACVFDLASTGAPHILPELETSANGTLCSTKVDVMFDGLATQVKAQLVYENWQYDAIRHEKIEVNEVPKVTTPAAASVAAVNPYLSNSNGAAKVIPRPAIKKVSAQNDFEAAFYGERRAVAAVPSIPQEPVEINLVKYGNEHETTQAGLGLSHRRR